MNISEELVHDTTKPYEEVDYKGIEYTTCKDYDHISRYKRLRQVIHYLDGTKRFLTLELQNDYEYTNVRVEYYVVPVEHENRLDLISYKYYDTPSYAWLIAHINGISDGYTVFEGQTLMIPTNLTDLYGSSNILSSIPISMLNLGTE